MTNGLRTVYTYKIETGTSAVTGDPWWTVVERRDGIAMGGDHHWLRERYADRAALLYARDHTLHGKSSEVLAYKFADYGYGRMFDKD